MRIQALKRLLKEELLKQTEKGETNRNEENQESGPYKSETEEVRASRRKNPPKKKGATDIK